MTLSGAQTSDTSMNESAEAESPAAKRLDDIGKLLEAQGYTDVRFSFGGMAKKTRTDIYDAVADALEAILASDASAEPEALPGKGYGLKS